MASNNFLPYFNNNLKNNNSSYTSPSLDRPAKSFEGNRDFFEIFGIKLFFDDLIIIALIIFLYNEDVKDQFLFIALILLLLS
ncbi:MAG: hypothetical protein ACI4VE_06405 [Clostridia bacterium]